MPPLKTSLHHAMSNARKSLLNALSLQAVLIIRDQKSTILREFKGNERLSLVSRHV